MLDSAVEVSTESCRSQGERGRMCVIRQIQCDCDQRESITVKQEERIVSIELPLEHEDHEPFRTLKETKQMKESLTF